MPESPIVNPNKKQGRDIWGKQQPKVIIPKEPPYKRYVLYQDDKRIWDEYAPSLTYVFGELIEFMDYEFYDKLRKEFEEKGELPIQINDGGHKYKLIQENVFDTSVVKESGNQGTAPESVAKIIEDVKKKPLRAPEKRDEIRRGLTALADSIDRSAITELRNFRPLGMMSEFGAAMGAEPRKGVRIDTPYGPYVFDEKRIPSNERVDSWYAQHKEAGGIRTLAVEYGFGLGASPNTVTGNFRVVERGRRFKEQGMLSPEEEQILNALEKYWQEHPEFDRQKGYGIWANDLEIMVPEKYRAQMAEKREKEKLGGTGMAEQYEEKPPGQEVRDWMKRALGIEDYKGIRHDRISMLSLLIQNSELGNIRSINEAGQMARALGKDLGYGEPPAYGKSQERYYAEKIAAETGREVHIIKSSDIIKPPAKEFVESGAIAGGTPARHILTITEPEGYYFGTQIEVLQGANPDLEPYFTGTIKRLLNNGELVEVHPDGDPREVSFRVPVDRVNVIRLVQQEGAEPTKIKKLYRYYYLHRPPSIGTQPEGFINHESWLPAKTTPHGRTAFGWVEYDRSLTPEETSRYELFEDEVELPKLVKELVQFAHDEGIDEAMKAIDATYGRAVWDWLKAQKRIRAGLGQKEQIRDEIIRLAGITAAPKDKFAEIQDQMQKDKDKIAGDHLRDIAGQMTSKEFINEALRLNRYREKYEKDPKLMNEFTSSGIQKWKELVEKHGEVGKLPDKVIEDYVQLFGEQALFSVFRGTKAKGIEGWRIQAIPPSVPETPDQLYAKLFSGWSALSKGAQAEVSDKDMIFFISTELKIPPEQASKLSWIFKQKLQDDYNEAMSKAKAEKEIKKAEEEKQAKANELKFWDEVKNLKVVDYEVQHDINPDKPARTYYHVYDRTFAILENGKKVQVSYVINKGVEGQRAAKATKEFYMTFYGQYMGKPLSEWMTYEDLKTGNRYEDYKAQKPSPRFTFIPEAPQAAPPAEQPSPNGQARFNAYIKSTVLQTGALASPKFLSDERMAQDIERNIQVSIDEARALVPQFRAIAEKMINKEEVESVKKLFGIDVEQKAYQLGIDLADYAIVKAGNKVVLQHKTTVQRRYDLQPPVGFMKKQEEETQERLREAQRRKALTVTPAAPPVAKPAQSIQEVKQQVLDSIQAARSVEELQPVLKGIGFLPLPEPEKRQVMDAYQNRYSILMSERPFGVPVKAEVKPKVIGAPTPQQLFEAEQRRKAGEVKSAFRGQQKLTSGASVTKRLSEFGIKERMLPGMTASMRSYIQGAQAVKEVIHYYRDGRTPTRGVLYRARDRTYFVEANDGQVYASMGWEEVKAQPQGVREPARYAGARVAARGYG